MSIGFEQRLTADSDGEASWEVGRAGFSALVTLVHIKPVNSVNVLSKGAVSLSSGHVVVEDVDVSEAVPLAALNAGTAFTVNQSERLIISISGATNNNQFAVTVHAIPLD